MDKKAIIHRLMHSGSTLLRSRSETPPRSADRSGLPVLDHNAFSVLDQLQQLLPPEDSERYLLLEMSLAQETHFWARSIYRQSRRQRREPDPIPESKPPSRLEPLRLKSSIVPRELEELLFRKIEEEQLYLFEDITLSALAHELEIEPHQLSRFLNHYLHTTFHDLINAYRVKAAQERLRQTPSETILDIAFAVGFNSKASFNRVFKKATGTTPSRYRKLHETSVSGPVP